MKYYGPYRIDFSTVKYDFFPRRADGGLSIKSLRELLQFSGWISAVLVAIFMVLCGFEPAPARYLLISGLLGLIYSGLAPLSWRRRSLWGHVASIWIVMGVFQTFSSRYHQLPFSGFLQGMCLCTRSRFLLFCLQSSAHAVLQIRCSWCSEYRVRVCAVEETEESSR